MTLHARITLIVTVSFALLIGGTLYGTMVREQVQAERFAASRVRAQQALWQQVIGREAQGLTRRLGVLEDAPELPGAMAAGDRAAVPPLMQPIAFALFQESVPLVEVVDPQGGLLYSSSGVASVEGRAVTEAAELARAAEAGVTQTAVLRGHNGGLMVAVVHPVMQGDLYAGSVILGRPVASVLKAIKDETGIDVFIADPRGGLLEGTAPELWTVVEPALSNAGMSGVFDMDAGDQVLGIVARPLSSAGGSRLAVHITAEDVTLAHGRLEQMRKLSAVASLLFGAVLLIGLSVYMTRSFRPLKNAIEGLDALSHGDMSVEIDGGREGDEVGRVAQAVRIFRDRLRGERRRAEGRDRRRRRQQRFIRGQMLSLADMLDADARAEVLRDLDRIERGEGDAAADSLPLAFELMVRRVRDQHGRLDTLVARLQDALEAKTELAGLQQQMEAAGRMQVSMLPPPLPARDDLEVAGALRQAEQFDGVFYDYMILPDGRLVTIFGQIEGEGLPAAFVTHTTRALLRAAVFSGQAPGEVLGTVNRQLCEDGGQDAVAHALVAVLEPASGRVSYAVAGRLSAVLLRRIGDVARVRSPDGGAPLGMAAETAYEARSVDMPQKATLLLCSGGVEAAFAAGGAGGDAGLMAALRVVDDLTPGPLVGSLTAEAEARGDGQHSRDLACLAVRYAGPLS